MQYIKQDDFDNFICIADKCPKSCCIGWQIVIDDDALEEYTDYISEGIDYDEGVFIQHHRRCAMLNDDNLCNIQLEKGHDALCYTCRTYPRHVEEYEGVREYTLALSCPAVAKEVVERNRPYEFIELFDEESEDIDDFEDFDYLLYTKLCDARDIIIKLLKDRSFDVEQRLGYTLDFARRLQDCIDDDRVYEMDDVIANFGACFLDKSLDNEATGSNSHVIKESELKCDISFLYRLERLEEGFTDYIDAGMEYEKLCKDASINPMTTLTEKEEIACENILVLLTFTYFCGAVYDDEIFSKAALCVYSLWWIVCIYKGLLNRKTTTNDIDAAGIEDLELLTLVLYTYTREVEHSDINLEMIEELFYSS